MAEPTNTTCLCPKLWWTEMQSWVLLASSLAPGSGNDPASKLRPIIIKCTSTFPLASEQVHEHTGAGVAYTNTQTMIIIIIVLILKLRAKSTCSAHTWKALGSDV